MNSWLEILYIHNNMLYQLRETSYLRELINTLAITRDNAGDIIFLYFR